MPSGAGPGDGVLFSTVGKNNERLGEEPCVGGLERKALNATAARTASPSKMRLHVHAPPGLFPGRAAEAIDLERFLLNALLRPLSRHKTSFSVKLAAV